MKEPQNKENKGRKGEKEKREIKKDRNKTWEELEGMDKREDENMKKEKSKRIVQ